MSIQPPSHRVVLRSKLDPGYVFYAHHATVRRFAHHNLPEFFRRSQSSLCANRIGELLS